MNNNHIHCSTTEDTALFTQSFLKEGFVFLDGKYEVETTNERIFGLISKAFNNTIKPITSGVYNGALGAINIEAIGDVRPGVREVFCKIAALPEVIRGLERLFKIYTPKTTREDGVFDIIIKHWYLDKTDSASGQMKVIEHYKDTKSFPKLIPEIYPRIKLNEMMKLYSESDECSILLSGAPGTGKTCFAKMMMVSHAIVQDRDIEVVYVKDIELLKKDSFWALMQSEMPDMIILDDLDNELQPRTKGRNEVINNLLSYSDGIFDVSTKIIITTNLADTNIDAALVRPGRCFDVLSLPTLSREEAINIWTDTLSAPISEFESRFIGLLNISQAALMSEHQRYLKSDSPTYLLDPTISVRKLVEDGHLVNHED